MISDSSTKMAASAVCGDGCGGEGVASAVWSGGLIIAIIAGTIINLLVIIHWFCSRPCNCSPSAALPFADFFMSIIGAPIRYSLEETESQQRPSLDVGISSFDGGNSTAQPGTRDAPSFTAEGATVIVLCLTSLHVITAVAFYRLLFVINCVQQKQSREGKPIVPVFVLLGCFVFSVILFIIFQFSGGFSGDMLLLSVSADHIAISDGMSIAAFPIYMLLVCFVTVSCYLVLVCSLVYHELSSRSCRKSGVRINPIQKIRDSLICPGRIIQDDPRLNQLHLKAMANEDESPEDRQVAMARQELRGRAFCSITGLLIALVICWMLPVCLTLHAIFAADLNLIQMAPRMDALVFMSAVAHPFLYGEAWLAVPFCVSWSKSFLVALSILPRNN